MKHEEDTVASVLQVNDMIKLTIMEYILFGCLCLGTISFAFLMLTLALKQIKDLKEEKKLSKTITDKYVCKICGKPAAVRTYRNLCSSCVEELKEKLKESNKKIELLQVLKEFKQQGNCELCGSQLCDGTLEFAQGCQKFKEFVKEKKE